jgi:hypothetical protein
MKKACLTLLCWLSVPRLLFLSLLLPTLADAVLQETVLRAGISLPVRRIWAAILLFPLLMPFFGGGAAETSSSGAATSASSTTEARRNADSQRQRDRRTRAAVGSQPSQAVQLPLRRTAPAPLPGGDALESASRRARVTAPTGSVAPPPANRSSSGATISASSTEARRNADSQRQRDHRWAHQNRRGATRAQIEAMEAGIMTSYKFTVAELAYAADNFERSPVAALAFSVANTGIANTPEDLGPLLDGPPNPGASILAFKRRTETPLHGCACCGMRTYDCIRLTERVLDMHIMTATDVAAFDALPPVLQQVKSTCTIAGRRYMLHPELVHPSSGDAF